MRRLLAFLAMLAAAPAAQGDERVVAGLSQDSISITTRFDGTEILIFGAVQREAPPPQGELQVIVTVEGPPQDVVIRRKDRRLGLWVNTEAVEANPAPSFYAVASSAPLDWILAPDEDARWLISIPRAIADGGEAIAANPGFAAALMRIRTREGLYQSLPGAVALSRQVLFSTKIRLPASLTEGDYQVRIFLTRNGRVVDAHSDWIDVEKAGLERWLFRLSREMPLAYGLLAIALAVAAGWSASAAFRYLRS